MGMSAPKGPSRAQIKTEAELEAERVKFENERRMFVERVASYELLATENRRQMESSLEFTAPETGQSASSPSGLFIPAKFNPSFDPNKFAGNRYAASNMDWFNAPNLGITPTQLTTPPEEESQYMINRTWRR